MGGGGSQCKLFKQGVGRIYSTPLMNKTTLVVFGTYIHARAHSIIHRCGVLISILCVCECTYILYTERTTLKTTTTTQRTAHISLSLVKQIRLLLLSSCFSRVVRVF